MSETTRNLIKEAEEQSQTITLSASEYKWIKEQMIKEESNSLECRIEWAKKFLKAAKELYPDKEFECWVGEDSNNFHFKVKGKDKFWSNVSTAEVINKVSKHLDKQTEAVEKRYYIT